MDGDADGQKMRLDANNDPVGAQLVEKSQMINQYRKQAGQKARLVAKSDHSMFYNPSAYTAMPSRMSPSASSFLGVIFSLKMTTPKSVMYR